jgi:RPA family protein
MAGRELAWRVFAGEYNQANLQVTEGGERAPSFVVTPLGARVNRLLVMGVLTSLESVGKDGEMWKARISDPTGQFTMYAGQYQPEAAKALAELRPPALVAVVGKSRTYQPEPGVTLVSIRPERVTQVSREERDHWTLETVKRTRQRLEFTAAALDMEAPTPDALAAMGCPRDLAEGILQALQHYGKPELVAYRAMVRDALEAVATGRVPDRAPSLPPPTRGAPASAPAPAARAPAMPAAPSSPPAPPAPDEDAKLLAEERVAALVKSLDEGKGAAWEGIVAEAAKSGLAEADVEEAINSLLDKGLVYEPVLGRLKAT